MLVRVIAPAAYAGAAPLVLPLSSSVLVANLYNFSPGLWIAKRTVWIALVSVGAGLFNLGLNFLLIPRMGLVGAAFATLASAIVAGAAHAFLGRVFYPVPFQWRRLGGAAALVCLGALPLGYLGEGILVRVFCWSLLSAVTSATLLGGREIRSVLEHIKAHRFRRRLAQESP